MLSQGMHALRLHGLHIEKRGRPIRMSTAGHDSRHVIPNRTFSLCNERRQPTLDNAVKTALLWSTIVLSHEQSTRKFIIVCCQKWGLFSAGDLSNLSFRTRTSTFVNCQWRKSKMEFGSSYFYSYSDSEEEVVSDDEFEADLDAQALV